MWFRVSQSLLSLKTVALSSINRCTLHLEHLHGDIASILGASHGVWPLKANGPPVHSAPYNLCHTLSPPPGTTSPPKPLGKNFPSNHNLLHFSTSSSQLAGLHTYHQDYFRTSHHPHPICPYYLLLSSLLCYPAEIPCSITLTSLSSISSPLLFISLANSQPQVTSSSCFPVCTHTTEVPWRNNRARPWVLGQLHIIKQALVPQSCPATLATSLLIYLS